MDQPVWFWPNWKYTCYRVWNNTLHPFSESPSTCLETNATPSIAMLQDLISIGVTALGPRKKIAHALNELKGNMHEHERPTDRCKDTMDGSKKLPVPGNKLITEFFQGSSIVDKSRDRYHGSTTANRRVERSNANSNRKRTASRNRVVDGRLRDIPPWCCIPGTPFRVVLCSFSSLPVHHLCPFICTSLSM